MTWQHAPLRAILPVAYDGVRGLQDRLESVLIIGVFLLASVGGRLSEGPTGWLVLVAGVVVLSVLTWRRFQFSLGQEAVALRKGLFLKARGKLAYDNIDRAVIAQNFLHQLLGLYQVDLYTKGSSEAALSLVAVDKQTANRFERWSVSSEAEEEGYTLSFDFASNVKAYLATPMGDAMKYFYALFFIAFMGQSLLTNEVSSVEKAQRAGESFSFALLGERLSSIKGLEGYNLTLSAVYEKSPSMDGVFSVLFSSGAGWLAMIAGMASVFGAMAIAYIVELAQRKLTINSGEVTLLTGWLKRKQETFQLEDVTHLDYTKACYGLVPWYSLTVHTLSGDVTIRHLSQVQMQEVTQRLGYDVFDCEVVRARPWLALMWFWMLTLPVVILLGLGLLATNQEWVTNPWQSLAYDLLLLSPIIVPFSLVPWLRARAGVKGDTLVCHGKRLAYHRVVIKREKIITVESSFLFGHCVQMGVICGGFSKSLEWFPERTLTEIASLSPA